MLFFDGVLGLVMVGVWIFCFFDVLLTPNQQVRNVPKLAWVFIVLLLPEVGSIAWLVLGRPWNAARTAASADRPKAAPGFGQLTRPNRRVPTNPDDDEEFLASLRKRTEEQRRSAREAQQRDQGDTPEPV